jgi:hypothetical protein
VIPILCACAGQTAAPLTDAPQPRVLAELTGPAGQKVVFLETGPDEVSVQETGSLGAPPMLDRKSEGLVDLYTQLAPAVDARVVEVLERADQYAAELEREPPPDYVAPEPEAPADARPHGAAEGVSAIASALQEIGPNQPLTGDQFVALACSWAGPPIDGTFCAPNTTSASSGWPGETYSIRSLTWHNGGPGSVRHDERKWVCISTIPLVGCVSWDWRTTTTLIVAPGQYGLFTNEGRRTRYQASCPSTTRFHFSAAWDLR